MVRRHAEARLDEALADTRIVTVEGPRQAGKSTMCAAVAAERGVATYSLDDAPTLGAARTDPVGFVAGLGEKAFIDEVQRAPDLILALKAEVDRDPRAGRFLVAGSANLLLAPGVGDSLAGRVERIPLRPFTQAEIAGAPVPAWLDGLWAGDPPPQVTSESVGRHSHVERIAAGGFPAASDRPPRRRRAWFDDYLAALVARDVPDPPGPLSPE